MGAKRGATPQIDADEFVENEDQPERRDNLQQVVPRVEAAETPDLEHDADGEGGEKSQRKGEQDAAQPRWKVTVK